MKRKLSPWCKEVKKTLIDRDMSVTELCGEVGMCRNYVTTTINGRMYAPALAEKSARLWISIQSTQSNYHNLIIQLIEGEKNVEICYESSG